MIEEKELPLVSVVVPCYNHEKYVKETIESIVNQTYKNIELIVIDDGSKDNSVSLIQELADKYGFTFIHRPNKGLSATLNEGIKLSKGKYFCACASDDMYMLDKIEKQVEFMESNPEYGMCYGKIIEFDETGYKKEREIKNAKSGWIFDWLLIGCFIPAPATLLKKSIFEDIDYFDESLWIEDWDMWLRISSKFQIGFINEFLAYYRRHETNISKQSFKMYKSELKILSKYKKHSNYTNIMKDRKIYWFLLLSKDFKKESLKYLYHSMKYFFVDLRVVKGLIKLIFFKANNL